MRMNKQTLKVDNEFLTRKKLVSLTVQMQNDALLLADRYKNELRRYYYVTPTIFLGLFDIFSSLYEKQINNINDMILHYQAGLEKLYATEEEVTRMQ